MMTLGSWYPSCIWSLTVFTVFMLLSVDG